MGMDRNNSLENGHVLGLVSAYIDSALDAADEERVRAHMPSCEVCQAEYREIQATRQMLRALPVQAPPRVFTLTEEMVGVRAGVAAGPSWLSRLLGKAMAPRLATGSVLAFALMLIILVSDLGLLNRMPDMAATETARQAAPMAGASQQGTQTTASSKAAPTDPTPMPMFAADSTSTTAAAEGNATAQDTAGADAANQANATPDVGGAGGGLTEPAPPQPTPAPEQADSNAQAAPTATTDTDMAEAVPRAVPTTGPTENTPGYTPQAGEPTPGELVYSVATGETEQANDQAQNFYRQPGESNGSGPPVTLLLEIGLALLGIGLAVAALVARRRIT